MKTIQNKKTAELKDADGKPLDYVMLCRAVVAQTPRGGFTYASMLASFRVDMAIDKAKDKIELEDADYITLVKHLDVYMWGRKSVDIIQFVDDVKGA